MPDLFKDRGFKKVVWIGGPQDGAEVIVSNEAVALTLPYTVGDVAYPIIGDRVIYTERRGQAGSVL